jgi:hypothetical protein
VRVTRKWVDEAGAPHCPKDGAVLVDGAEEPEDREAEGMVGDRLLRVRLTERALCLNDRASDACFRLR